MGSGILKPQEQVRSPQRGRGGRRAESRAQGTRSRQPAGKMTEGRGSQEGRGQTKTGHRRSQQKTVLAMGDTARQRGRRGAGSLGWREPRRTCGSDGSAGNPAERLRPVKRKLQQGVLLSMLGDCKNQNLSKEKIKLCRPTCKECSPHPSRGSQIGLPWWLRW